MQKKNNKPIFLMPVSPDGNPQHLPCLDATLPVRECVHLAECPPDLNFNSADADYLLGQKRRQSVWIDGMRPRWI